MRAEIIRNPDDYTEHGVFGALLLADDRGPVLGLATLEEEWLDNETNISCIPNGTYLCRRTVYHKKQRNRDPWWSQFDYQTFEITGVDGRDRLLFHIGNTEEDTQGCVILGTDAGQFEVEDEEGGGRMVKRGVAHSKTAFKMFMDALRGIDEFTLVVRDAAL